MNFRQSIQVFIDQNLAPAAQSAQLASVARQTVQEAVTSGAFPAVYETFVDGQEGADESNVRPDGVISYLANYLGDATEFALAFLQARSQPEQSGLFVSGFQVSINGRPFTVAQFDKSMVPQDAEIFVFNVEPYARKIDTGYSGPRALKYRIPSGIFDDATAAVQRQFRGIIRAQRLQTVRFPSQYVTKHGGRLVDSPAVVLSSV